MEELVKYFKRWPKQDVDQREAAVDYALGHVADWPPYLRTIKDIDPAHPCWRLCDTIQLYGAKQYAKLTPQRIEKERQTIATIDMLQEATHIKQLSLINFHQLDDLSPIAECHHLQSLHFEGTHPEPTLPSLSWLTDLTIKSPPNQNETRYFQHNPQLHSLSLTYCRDIHSTDYFSPIPQLHSLRIVECSQTDCQPISQLHNLKRVAYDDTALASLDGLEQLPQLKHLSIQNAWQVTTIKPIKVCTQLHSLSLRGLRHITSLQALQDMTQLEELDLHNCNKLDNIHDISHIVSLRTLTLSKWDSEVSGYTPHYTPWKDLTALSRMTALEELNLERCNQLETLKGIEHCQALRTINLAHCTRLQDITALQNLPQLESINLDGCKAITKR